MDEIGSTMSVVRRRMAAPTIGLVGLLLAGGCTGSTPRIPPAPETIEADGTTGQGADPDSCDPSDLGVEKGEVVVVYRVVDGELGPVCFGADAQVVRGAWEILVGFAPPEERRFLGRFGGFTNDDGTLAFAAPVGGVNDEFGIAVDLLAGRDDPEELRLTLAHELAHVLTQTPDQMDIDIGPEACSTYWNGFGCFERASYMVQWIDEYWTDDELAGLPDDGGTDESGGDDRCELDPGFLGPYAASHPEEDFAESFGAFVFDLPVPPEVEPRLAFFGRFPELVVLRDRVRSSGRIPPPNNFDRCG